MEDRHIMRHFKYYAIGHSYLKHGPFKGWQTDGYWGMAASAPENDYFHKFQDILKENFECKLTALAENHADYERLCREGESAVRRILRGYSLFFVPETAGRA